MRLGRRTSFLGVVLVLLCVAIAGASQAPVTVSPGTATGARIGDPCPTFSWGAVPGAKSYQLVVYELGQEGEEPEAVLRQELPGSASGWTPSLDSCLERGGQYAWSVRAVGGEATSEWSSPALFQVAAGPTQQEFEAALQVVKAYLATTVRGVAESEVADATEAQPDPESQVAGGSPGPRAVGTTQLTVEGGIVAESITADGSTLTNLDPSSLASAVPVSKGGTGAVDAAGARTNLNVVAGPHTVDTDDQNLAEVVAAGNDAGGLSIVNVGAIVATSLSGDGSALTDLDGSNIAAGTVAEPRIDPSIMRRADFAAESAAERACMGSGASSDRFTDCGNGTVRDNNTGLIWLKEADCYGELTWFQARDSAIDLADGACGLTDDSVAGDWRLPTISEFCSAFSGSDLYPCPAGAASDSLIDSSLEDPAVPNAAGTGVWTQGDAFVDVQSSFYWSDTYSRLVDDPAWGTGTPYYWEAELTEGEIKDEAAPTVAYFWPVRTGQ